VKDCVNSEQWDLSLSNQMFKPKTNLPLSIFLQPGACVMHLNNSLINQGICNGMIGVITDPQDECVQIVFSVKRSIVDVKLWKHPIFWTHGSSCHRIQFPWHLWWIRMSFWSIRGWPTFLPQILTCFPGCADCDVCACVSFYFCFLIITVFIFFYFLLYLISSID
jgi:hypothetical protein